MVVLHRPPARRGRARYGFEYVIFRAERGQFPTSWASHLAITDEGGDRFLYGQRLEIGRRVDRSPRAADGQPTGFDFSLSGADPSNPTTAGRPAWAMSGVRRARITGGRVRARRGRAGGLARRARPRPATGGHQAGGAARRRRLDRLRAGRRLVLLLAHGDDGRGHADRRRARRLSVDGSAWFDHQWGDFISVGGGGWDWFAVNLDDGTDLTLSLVRDADGSYPLIYGTRRRAATGPSGISPRRLRGRGHRPLDQPGDGRRLPGRLVDHDPGRGPRDRRCTPTVAAQELDTRATTGVVYWEGSQVVRATRAGSRSVARATSS